MTVKLISIIICVKRVKEIGCLSGILCLKDNYIKKNYLLAI